MTDKIKSCFIDDQVDFYGKVNLNGEHIATIRHLTDSEIAMIRRMPKGGDSTNMIMTVALGGFINGRSYKIEHEGWSFKDRPVTEMNFSLLLPEYKLAIIEEFNNRQKQWEDNQKAISGN